MSYQEDVEKWKKNYMKKVDGIWLLRKEFDGSIYGIDTKAIGYTCIVKCKRTGKIKLVYFKDGMYCRYGPKTIATIGELGIPSLWTSGPDSLSEADLISMLDFIKGSLSLESFSLDTLKNLQH